MQRKQVMSDPVERLIDDDERWRFCRGTASFAVKAYDSATGFLI